MDVYPTLHEKAAILLERLTPDGNKRTAFLLTTLDVRRTTRDADMLAREVSSDERNLRTVVGEIAAIPIGAHDENVSRWDPTERRWK